jgi:hypothetical protein
MTVNPQIRPNLFNLQNLGPSAQLRLDSIGVLLSNGWIRSSVWTDTPILVLVLDLSHFSFFLKTYIRLFLIEWDCSVRSTNFVVANFCFGNTIHGREGYQGQKTTSV